MIRRRLNLDEVGTLWATGLIGAGVGAIRVWPTMLWWTSYAVAWAALLLRCHYERIIKENKH